MFDVQGSSLPKNYRFLYTVLKGKLSSFSLHTLVRLIMTGNIVAGKNNGGYKYGGFAEKPPNLTRHFFTCNIIFTKIL